MNALFPNGVLLRRNQGYLTAVVIGPVQPVDDHNDGLLGGGVGMLITCAWLVAVPGRYVDAMKLCPTIPG